MGVAEVEQPSPVLDSRSVAGGGFGLGRRSLAGPARADLDRRSLKARDAAHGAASPY
jgi:hypothetical protein